MRSKSDRVDTVGSTQSNGAYLELRGIRKSYGGVRALKDVTLSVGAPGVIHALAGENGSGKSTLLGILSGQITSDEGSIWLNGERLALRSPADAVRNGICMVSQETSVALDLSVTENVLMGRMPKSRLGVIDWRRSHQIVRGVLARLESDLDPGITARDLRPDQLQIVEIARALSMDAKVLILDEPTSSLNEDEAQSLMRVIRDLQREQVTTIFVSHRMAEVFALADEITVIRDGITAFSGPAKGQTHDSLVSAMLGDTKAARASELSAHHGRERSDERVALEVSSLSAPGAFEDVTLNVHVGEIVGIAGLEGAGRNELLESLFGERKTSSGRIRVRDEEFIPSSPRAAIDNGIAYLPPDRKGRGLVLTMSISSNASIVGTLGSRRHRRPPADTERRLLKELIDVTRLRMSRSRDPISTLSGGNQQKVSLGKWLVDGKDILLLDEPTRGVDIGAKLEIHGLLRRTADAGAAMLVSSSENEELLALCDRILVMSRRRIVADIDAKDATLELLTRYAREGTDNEH